LLFILVKWFLWMLSTFAFVLRFSNFHLLFLSLSFSLFLVSNFLLSFTNMLLIEIMKRLLIVWSFSW
jgi:hypothetical protein